VRFHGIGALGIEAAQRLVERCSVLMREHSVKRHPPLAARAKRIEQRREQHATHNRRNRCGNLAAKVGGELAQLVQPRLALGIVESLDDVMRHESGLTDLSARQCAGCGDLLQPLHQRGRTAQDRQRHAQRIARPVLPRDLALRQRRVEREVRILDPLDRDAAHRFVHAGEIGERE